MGVTGIQIENSLQHLVHAHKQFVMDRSHFFQVIIDCQFEEGNRFREQESANQLPIIELYQCSNQDILVQTLNFIYCESANITDENYLELLTVGELFGLDKLVKSCDKYFKHNVRVQKSDLYEHYKYALSCDRTEWSNMLSSKTLEHLTEECKQGNMDYDSVYEELTELGVPYSVLSASFLPHKK